MAILRQHPRLILAHDIPSDMGNSSVHYVDLISGISLLLDSRIHSQISLIILSSLSGINMNKAMYRC